MSTKATDRAAYISGRIVAAIYEEIQRDSLKVVHDDSGTTLGFSTRGVPMVVRVEVKE